MQPARPWTLPAERVRGRSHERSAAHRRARSAPEPGRPRNGISIDLRAGYGATAEAVPATLRLAIRILVAHWFENRGDVVGEQILPPEALALVAPFQRARL